MMKEIQPLIQEFPDYLPDSVRQEHNLLSLGEAIGAMHWPESIAEINHARLRLGFDEVLMLMVPSLLARREREQEQTEKLSAGDEAVSSWCETLPFILTQDQEAAISDILHDLGQTKPMNRLIQGDVGTGKTVVGLAGALKAIASGKQVVWLAPTELLARQHFATARELLHGPGSFSHPDPPVGGSGSLRLSEARSGTSREILSPTHKAMDYPHVALAEGDRLSPQNDQQIGIGLWTRTNHFIATSAGETKADLADVVTQPLIFGTHALLSEKVQLQNLGLLIIDEQHRFGVKQRAQLRTFQGQPVHLLSMTATPIPRTMALLLYGDLQLSAIKEKPAGRKPIVTRVVGDENREKAYTFIDEQITKGGQVYVVCPTIEPSKDDEANMFNQLFEVVEEKKAVLTWFEVLKKKFPHRRLGLLHGKLKAKEKEDVMNSFRTGEIDMLVSTTVIEVGVDVPNASIMVIEAADRFGLAQLHQLRGRVGRGERQSFCLLFPTSDTRENARLKIMEKSSDGFVLAEKDLELRGPGEITGLAQSGIPPLRFASLKDTQWIMEIKQITARLVDEAHFTQAFERFWRQHHPE